MSLLLDTHVWIWTQEEPSRIGPRATKQLTDPAEALYVATVSTLETARLIHGDLIELEGGLLEWVSASISSLGCGSLEMTHEIAATAYELPGNFHKDPADRIIVATARRHGLTLLTADEPILRYRHVKTIDARR